MIARVVTDVALDREFDYLVPPELASELEVGSAVDVPFGRTQRTGYVLSIHDTTEFDMSRMRPVTGVSSSRASIPKQLVELGRWMSEYYCCTLEQSIRTLLPAPVRNGKFRPKIRKIYNVSNSYEAQKELAKIGKNVRLIGRTVVLEHLLVYGECFMDELAKLQGFSRSALATLVKNGLVSVREAATRRDVFGNAGIVRDSALEPTPDQAKALAQIDGLLAAGGGVQLLHGTTNSGKTEVYLQAISKTMDMGKSSIVLVPEISLTPQTVRRFRARFGDALSVLHSRLSGGERFDEWNRIRSGEVKIAIGARSALFAPFSDLGLIVIDEEHESTYKQAEAPRYNARDVAVMRGQLEHAVVILGSATPSAESLHNAGIGRFSMTRMSCPVGHSVPPRFQVIDRRIGTDPDAGESSLFSDELVEAVRQRISSGEQCILFLNRRGYARTLSCDACGYVAKCDDCAVHCVYSRRSQTLSCHLCGAVREAPLVCPQCGNNQIRYSGSGTEKIESIAHALFPDARIGRMDSDSMRSADDYEEVLENFRQGKLDILVGTQMIAKGLHFPNVTLVGILNADQGLNMPDFRSSERTFQLITQVAGRAGRGDTPGDVILQTFNPQNDVIVYATSGDVDGFSKFDLEFREMMNYPPFSRMITILFRGEDEDAVKRYAFEFKDAISPYLHDGIKMVDPMPAPIERMKGKYRYVISVRGNGLATMRKAIRTLALHGAPPSGVEVAVDVDPQNMM
ncbi:MAG: primosomal protein N' [Victivallaceae bacterium]|nr:primosomal protein N' [Victivallaceae bacterium]